MKKKLFSLFVVLVGLAFITEANAQMSKAMQKACKAKTKELTKGGWAIMGSSYTLDMALAKHYEKLDGKQEVFGTAISTQKNIGTAKLQQDAIEKYTTQIGMSIKGRVTTQHGSQVSSDAMEEIDSFLQGFDGKVQAGKEGLEAAGKWVGDKAQKTGKAIRTGAAMGMGAVILGADVTIKGVKKVGSKVGEKGQEVGRMAVAAKNKAVEKAKGLWARAKERAKAGKALSF